jgi:hypothetical protein
MTNALGLHKEELDALQEKDLADPVKSSEAGRKRAIHASANLMLAMEGLSVSEANEGAFDTPEIPQLHAYTGGAATLPISTGYPPLPSFSQEQEGGLAQTIWSEDQPHDAPGYDASFPIAGQGPADWNTDYTASSGYFGAGGYEINYDLPRQEYNPTFTQQLVPFGRTVFSHNEGFQLSIPQTQVLPYEGDPHWQELISFPRDATAYVKNELQFGQDGNIELHQEASGVALLPLVSEPHLLPSFPLQREGGLAHTIWSGHPPQGSSGYDIGYPNQPFIKEEAIDDAEAGYTDAGGSYIKPGPVDKVGASYSGIRVPGFDYNAPHREYTFNPTVTQQTVPGAGWTDSSRAASHQMHIPQTKVEPYGGDDHWQGFPTHCTTIGGHTAQSEATGYVKSEHGFKQELGTASTFYDVIPPSSDFTFRYSVPYVDDTVRRPEDPRLSIFSSVVPTRPVPRSDPYYRTADAVSSRSHGVAFADDGIEEEGGERGGKRVKQEDVL